MQLFDILLAFSDHALAQPYILHLLLTRTSPRHPLCTPWLLMPLLIELREMDQFYQIDPPPLLLAELPPTPMYQHSKVPIRHIVDVLPVRNVADGGADAD